MKASITGASGFVGKSLSKMLEKLGYEIVSLDAKDCASIEVLTQKIANSDVIINLAGAPIIKRWSEDYKKVLRSSRIETTKRLVEAISRQEVKPKFMFSTSAVGYYESNIEFDEDGKNGNDFLATLCKDWESSALEATRYGVRVCIGRFGIVLGKNGGALSQMLPIFKLGFGGVIASGKQPMSYIQLDDLISAILFLINNENLDGTFNFTTPNVVTNYEFTKTLGSILNRPTLFPVPEFALKILYSEGAKVLTDGQIALPKKLPDSGFKFNYPTLKQALLASV
ncbi:MAG: hypothetical protein RL154_1174 [Pseudomonadota bacterium]|jgi:uncharacterized protein (TIGR01777 family)